MRGWNAEQVADAAGAELVRAPLAVARGSARAVARGPARAVVDSRGAGPGDLFVGVTGARADGGEFAPDVLAAGAWGVLVTPAHAATAVAAALLDKSGGPGAGGVEAGVAGVAGGAILVSDDPVAALGRLARAWRRHLGARVLAVTGSTGKTSTKDLLTAVLAPQLATHANRANLNTEIGLPLSLLETPVGTEAIVLELAMRGAGQIAELAAICEPDVGVVVNVGPVHLERLGSLEAVAAAKGELLDALAPGARAVVPDGETLLEPHLRAELDVVRCGPGGDARLAGVDPSGRARIDLRGRTIELEVSFRTAHQLENLVMAVAAADGVGVRATGRVDVAFSPLRGERVALDGNVAVVNDCYNANPMSMRAALDDLVASASGRRVAVLGDMLELGSGAPAYHADVGRQAAERGVELLVAVGPLSQAMVGPYRRTAGPRGVAQAVADAPAAADWLRGRLRAGDTVLVKASRGMGLERVTDRLAAGSPG